MHNTRLVLAGLALTAFLCGSAFAADEPAKPNAAVTAPATEPAAASHPRQANTEEYPAGKPDNGDINDPDLRPDKPRGPGVVPPSEGAAQH